MEGKAGGVKAKDCLCLPGKTRMDIQSIPDTSTNFWELQESPELSQICPTLGIPHGRQNDLPRLFQESSRAIWHFCSLRGAPAGAAHPSPSASHFSSSFSRDPSSGISSWFCCSILTTPSLAALPNPAGKRSGTREKNQQRIHQNPARTPPLLDFHHLGRNSFPGPPQGSTWLSHELKA